MQTAMLHFGVSLAFRCLVWVGVRVTGSPEFVVLVYSMFSREYFYTLFRDKAIFVIAYTEWYIQYTFFLSINEPCCTTRRGVQSILHAFWHSGESNLEKTG